MCKKRKTCYYCNRKFGNPVYGGHMPLKPTVDHIIPKSKYGVWGNGNTIMACHYCNSLKGDMLPEEFIGYLSEMKPNQRFSEHIIRTMIQNIDALIKKITPNRDKMSYKPIGKGIKNYIQTLH